MGYFTSNIERLHRAVNREAPFDLGYLNPMWTPPKPAKQAAPTATVEAEAATDVDPATLPPVIEAPAPKITADEQARRLVSVLVIRLNNLACNDDLEKRRIDLLAQLEEFRKSLAVFLADQRAWIVADLTAQQEQASAACREQTAVIAGLESERAEALAAVRKASGLTSSCRALLNACEAEKPNLDAWPSRADVARWDAEHARLSEALGAAQQAEGQARSESRRIQARILEAERKLNELADAELTLRERLSGEAWSDHEVGLRHSPEV